MLSISGIKVEELRLAAEYELKQEEKLLREQREQEREIKTKLGIKARRKQLEKIGEPLGNMVPKSGRIVKKMLGMKKLKVKLQLAEYQDKLSELDEIEEDIDYRESCYELDIIYVISNIGSFGENVYKIGVTRRLELERIKNWAVHLYRSNLTACFDFSEEAL